MKGQPACPAKRNARPYAAAPEVAPDKHKKPWDRVLPSLLCFAMRGPKSLGRLGQVWRNVAIALASVSLALAVLAASYRRRFGHELVPLLGFMMQEVRLGQGLRLSVRGFRRLPKDP